MAEYVDLLAALERSLSEARELRLCMACYRYAREQENCSPDEAKLFARECHHPYHAHEVPS